MAYKLVVIEEINITMDEEELGFYNLRIKGKKDNKFKDIVISRKEFEIIDNIIDKIIPTAHNYLYSFKEINAFFSELKTLLDDSLCYTKARGKLEYDLDLMGSVYSDAWNTTVSEIIKVLEYVDTKYDSDADVMLVFVEQF